MAATNAAGTGPASAASNAVTPSATAMLGLHDLAGHGDADHSERLRHLAVTLGVKFKSDVDGTVTGIRFYKGSGNTGTHVGNLWSSTGTKLATATFANETASGWQQVNFTTPVSITAGTVYVASYLAPGRALRGRRRLLRHRRRRQRTPARPQGRGQRRQRRLRLRQRQHLPRHTFNRANYWVDVVFSSGAPTAPAAPTGVTATGGERVGDGELDGAVERRQRDHQLHGDAVHRDDGADADHGDR